MLLARVEGSAVSTIHHPTLDGWRLLVCQPIDEAGNNLAPPILAADTLGAGMHQRVIITSDGKTVAQRVGTRYTPLRYLTIGVLDDVA